MSSLDDIVQRLISPATRPSPVAIGWRRKATLIRGLSISDLIALAVRHPDARDTLWSVVGMTGRPVGKTGPVEARMLLDLLGTAIGSRSMLTTIRISRLPQAEFESLFRAVVDLTMPGDVEELFEPTDGDGGPRKRRGDIGGMNDGAWADPVVTLGKLVVHLSRSCFPEAADWTPGRALFVASVLAERDSTSAKSDLVNAAYAARLGQAPEKDWKKNIDALTKG